MIRQITDNIYCIKVELKGNPLRDLNSYFIRGTEKDLLIDTGFGTDDCRSVLRNALYELHSDPLKRNVYVTHFHGDHIGLARELTGYGCSTYLPEIDRQYLLSFQRKDFNSLRAARYMENGFPEETLLESFEKNRTAISKKPYADIRYSGLADQEVIDLGSLKLKVLSVPGHTIGNSMLYDEADGILFTGDHVLFDISPNITDWVDVDDPLGEYIKSLTKYKDIPVKLALPGHRETGDYRKRVGELLQHHKTRLDEALRIVSAEPGINAYDVTAGMQWRIRAKNWEDFPAAQKYFAFGEGLAHLEHLRFSGLIYRKMTGSVYGYYPVR